MTSEYAHGKQLLAESLRADSGKNKAYILHNLACGQWWHMEEYLHIEPEQMAEEKKKEYEEVLAEYKESIGNFRKAIMFNEGLDGEYDIDTHQLNSINSCVSIMNVSEIFMQNFVLDVRDR